MLSCASLSSELLSSDLQMTWVQTKAMNAFPLWFWSKQSKTERVDPEIIDQKEVLSEKTDKKEFSPQMRNRPSTQRIDSGLRVSWQ